MVRGWKDDVDRGGSGEGSKHKAVEFNAAVNHQSLLPEDIEHQVREEHLCVAPRC